MPAYYSLVKRVMIMEIAPGFTDTEWQKLTFSDTKDWTTAYGVFSSRINERFLKPISALLKFKRSGFAILALDSLLIETLQQFVEGVDETPRYKGKVYFQTFLKRPAFQNLFDDFSAELFYKTVRCGILHKAELKGTSLVRRDFPVAVQLSQSGDGLEINPVKFHALVKQAIDDYLTELKSGNNSLLRKKFLTKMRFICRGGIVV